MGLGDARAPAAPWSCAGAASTCDRFSRIGDEAVDVRTLEVGYRLSGGAAEESVLGRTIMACKAKLPRHGLDVSERRANLAYFQQLGGCTSSSRIAKAVPAR